MAEAMAAAMASDGSGRPLQSPLLKAPRPRGPLIQRRFLQKDWVKQLAAWRGPDPNVALSAVVLLFGGAWFAETWAQRLSSVPSMPAGTPSFVNPASGVFSAFWAAACALAGVTVLFSALANRFNASSMSASSPAAAAPPHGVAVEPEAGPQQ